MDANEMLEAALSAGGVNQLRSAGVANQSALSAWYGILQCIGRPGEGGKDRAGAIMDLSTALRRVPPGASLAPLGYARVCAWRVDDFGRAALGWHHPRRARHRWARAQPYWRGLHCSTKVRVRACAKYTHPGITHACVYMSLHAYARVYTSIPIDNGFSWFYEFVPHSCSELGI